MNNYIIKNVQYDKIEEITFVRDDGYFIIDIL